MDDNLIGKADVRYGLAVSLLKSAVRTVEATLDLDPIELSGLLGTVAGDYIACNDDSYLHDKEAMAHFEKVRAQLGTSDRGPPCADTFKLNYEYTHKEHMKTHNDIRAARDSADAQMSRVCESHKHQKDSK